MGRTGVVARASEVPGEQSLTTRARSSSSRGCVEHSRNRSGGELCTEKCVNRVLCPGTECTTRAGTFGQEAQCARYSR